MLAKKVKAQMFAAMKAKNTVEKEVLKVVLGEVDTAASRKGEDLSDGEVEKIIAKLVKSNRETLQRIDGDEKATIEQEIAILEAFLPKTLDVPAIIAALEGVKDQIAAAGNDGQATGVAMKTLKSSGAAVNGKDVAAAVKQMRAG